jgi:hypothetical protein
MFMRWATRWWTASSGWKSRNWRSLGVEKGAMTLIDAERRAELLRGLGELPGKRASGGSAANSMIAAAQMGARVLLLLQGGPGRVGSVLSAGFECLPGGVEPASFVGQWAFDGHVFGVDHAGRRAEHEHVLGRDGRFVGGRVGIGCVGSVAVLVHRGILGSQSDGAAGRAGRSCRRLGRRVSRLP